MTQEQVDALNARQRGEGEFVSHPYTCPNRGDGYHWHNGFDLGCLTAQEAKWYCETCGYTQQYR